ncbi:MAG: hypothetical protein WC423_16745 [Vulcanimicrobiota bacterium]
MATKRINLWDFRLLQRGRPSKKQLNTISLFNIPDLLSSRGFEWNGHGEFPETYIGRLWDKRGNVDRKHIEELSAEFENLRSSQYRQQKRVEFQAENADYNLYSRTIEALVGYLCVMHLGALSAEYGVRLENAPDGGDFDCLANFNNQLVFFEVKSGSLRNLTKDDAQNFLRRHEFLAPDISVMLVDYNGLKPQAVADLFKSRKLFAGHLSEILHVHEKPKFNIYGIQHNIFVVDVVKGDLLRNVREVLKFHRRWRSFAEQREFHRGKQPDWFGYQGRWL